MRILCVFGQHNYGDPGRGEGYEYSNFLPALERLGHEVVFFESRDRRRFASFNELNHALLKVVEKQRPDVLFAVQSTFEIWLETWELIRQSGLTATVNWTTDDSWKYGQSSRFLAPALHAFTTTYPDVVARYHHDGIEHVLLTQWAANAAAMQPPLPAAECHYPVSFVGTAHGSRRAWVEQLRERDIEVDCFGYGWPNGPVAMEELSRIVRHSVISLNFANAATVWQGLRPRQVNQIKARTFEVPGAGGFLLTELAPHLERYYVPGKEIAVFSGIEELAGQIRTYLSHPAERDRIAAAGFERTKGAHTYDRRLEEVLAFALDQKTAHERKRPPATPGRIDWEAFGRAAARHELHRGHRWLRRFVVAPATWVWGQKRGPRAARAAFFQVSYRLAGAHTYSAAGWPGRLFYQES